MRYNDGFKARMVQRPTGPEGITLYALSMEVGVHAQTLSRWVRERSILGAMTNKSNGNSKSPIHWSATKKFQVVHEANHLSDEDLGQFLREKGLQKAHLDEWRLVMIESLESSMKAAWSALAGGVSSIHAILCIGGVGLSALQPFAKSACSNSKPK